MNFLFTHGPGDDLHRAIAIVSPLADDDFAHAASACREQGGMPVQKSVFREGLVEVARRIEHHFDDAFDVSICVDETAHIHAETPGDGRLDLVVRQGFPLYFAGFDDILCEDLQMGFATMLESKPFHSSK